MSAASPVFTTFASEHNYISDRRHAACFLKQQHEGLSIVKALPMPDVNQSRSLRPSMQLTVELRDSAGVCTQVPDGEQALKLFAGGGGTKGVLVTRVPRLQCCTALHFHTTLELPWLPI